MAENKKHVYDESKIKTLSSLEHIRLRTGMYIGRIGDGSHYDDGCYILLKEVIDNGIDEFIMGYGKELQVEIPGHVLVGGRCAGRSDQVPYREFCVQLRLLGMAGRWVRQAR